MLTSGDRKSLAQHFFCMQQPLSTKDFHRIDIKLRPCLGIWLPNIKTQRLLEERKTELGCLWSLRLAQNGVTLSFVSQSNVSDCFFARTNKYLLVQPPQMSLTLADSFHIYHILETVRTANYFFFGGSFSKIFLSTSSFST